MIMSLYFRWSNLRNAADLKKAKLDKALKLQQFYAETTETKVRILSFHFIYSPIILINLFIHSFIHYNKIIDSLHES